MVIDYQDDVSGVEERHLVGFFDGWPRSPDPEAHLRLLGGSDHIVLARDRQSGMVVGFTTAISDGVLSAYIPFLEVVPGYRGRGIGSELVRRILVKLGCYYMVDLVCDPHMVGFYERFGMRQATSMVFRRREGQAGIAAR